MKRLPHILALTRDELGAMLQGRGEQAFRTEQVLAWVHQQLATDWAAMTNLPAPLRAWLKTNLEIAPLDLVRVQGAVDTTRKFLWRLHDGALIESVLIPANPALYGEASDRHTLCVSTQVGCAYGCRFCASGLEGWKRNLSADEIVGQVLAVERLLRHSSGSPEGTSSRHVNNLVIMGMGEPLANYDNLIRALTVLNAAWGARIGARKITISTSGLVPQIRRLATEPQPFGLAISLHAASNDVRDRIMPVNRKYPIELLMDAVAEYSRTRGRMVTLEYILIEGVNDQLDQARRLANLAKRVRAKVNLIPYNSVEGLPWSRPSESRQEAFLSQVERVGVAATLRREKGHDIDAACGQLRLRTERELAGR
jgi:23S rRNA (adenine2503-C2)-methyltransferase